MGGSTEVADYTHAEVDAGTSDGAATRAPRPRPVLPTAVATGIGSLPHDDPAAAVAFVLDELADLPAAPQLPRRHRAEGMLAQAVDGLPGTALTDDGDLVVDVDRLDAEEELELAFEGEAWRTLRTFLKGVATRRAPIKLQLTGPVTLGIALREAGVPADLAFDVASNVVNARARALVVAAEAAAPHAGLVVVLDEPGLVAWGTDRLPLRGDDVVDLLSGGLASLGHSVLTGVHCCADIDWKLVSDAGPDLVSLPATPGAARAALTLSAFLDRGGLVAWGVVPTDRPIGQGVDPLWRRLAELWGELTRLGCDPIRLRQQAVLTPSCGLAAHDRHQAARILDLTLGVAERVHSQAVAVRMSVGA